MSLNTITTSDVTNVNDAAGTGITAITGQVRVSSPAVQRTVGNGANQADREYPFQGTVTAGTPFTINLSTGLNPFSGSAMGMVHATRIHVVHQGTTGRITVGGGTHPVMGSDQATLQPGGSGVFDNIGAGYVVASGAVAGVEPVEALPVVDSSGVGTFTLTYMGITTGAITYSSTVATLITNINTALNSAFGTGNLVASGASLAALIITGTAGNYQYNAFGGHFVSTITVTGGNFTINGSSTSGTSTTTTAGVAVIAAEQDTLTITADAGTVPFSVVVLGRSA